jgi:hypothetical protein
LLLRWGGAKQPRARAAALKLIDIGESHGVRNGLAINSLLDDFIPNDTGARLWPQSERLKAAAIAARCTGEDRYFTMAVAAAEGLLRYLNCPTPGLWYDRIDANGNVIDEPRRPAAFIISCRDRGAQRAGALFLISIAPDSIRRRGPSTRGTHTIGNLDTLRRRFVSERRNSMSAADAPSRMSLVHGGEARPDDLRDITVVEPRHREARGNGEAHFVRRHDGAGGHVIVARKHGGRRVGWRSIGALPGGSP